MNKLPIRCSRNWVAVVWLRRATGSFLAGENIPLMLTTSQLANRNWLETYVATLVRLNVSTHSAEAYSRMSWPG